MEYHFKRQEISGDRLLFALSLDKKSAKERILIGSEIEIKKSYGMIPMRRFSMMKHAISERFL